MKATGRQRGIEALLALFIALEGGKLEKRRGVRFVPTSDIVRPRP
jgi:hypothetical protein